MKYPVGKLLTREYNDIERRILRCRLIRNTDSWANTIRFVCADGKVGFKDVDCMEEFEIADLVTRVRIAPYVEYLFMLEKYARIMQIMMPDKMPTTGKSSASLLKKYKWLYSTETWEGKKWERQSVMASALSLMTVSLGALNAPDAVGTTAPTS